MKNRVIKFRAWNEKHKSMGLPFEPFDYEFMASGGTFPPETVFMQFTGLHDKDGKDIYEGDIVTGTEGKYSFKVLMVKESWKAVSFNFRDVFDIPDHWEVIGNIFENPDLLK